MHSLIESYTNHISEIQDSLNDYRKRQEKLLEKAKKRDFDQRLLNTLFELPEKYRERIVMQKVKEGVYRGPFEEFYPVLREHGAEPKALEIFWNELGDIPVDDDGIILESFLWWPKGADREDIWRWFDEKYPGGVVKLMGLEKKLMCLYEPINGDFPRESFCNLHGPNCESCPYHYVEDVEKENEDASENL